MKAIRYPAFGGPEIVLLDEVPPPRPGSGEALIQVAVSSINQVDWNIGDGALQGSIDYLPPFIPGLDFAGVVLELGPGLRRLRGRRPGLWGDGNRSQRRFRRTTRRPHLPHGQGAGQPSAPRRGAFSRRNTLILEKLRAGKAPL